MMMTTVMSIKKTFKIISRNDTNDNGKNTNQNTTQEEDYFILRKDSLSWEEKIDHDLLNEQIENNDDERKSRKWYKKYCHKAKSMGELRWERPVSWTIPAVVRNPQRASFSQKLCHFIHTVTSCN
jgi:hypothetical protein